MRGIRDTGVKAQWFCSPSVDRELFTKKFLKSRGSPYHIVQWRPSPLHFMVNASRYQIVYITPKSVGVFLLIFFIFPSCFCWCTSPCFNMIIRLHVKTKANRHTAHVTGELQKAFLMDHGPFSMDKDTIVNAKCTAYMNLQWLEYWLAQTIIWSAN